MIIEEQFPKLDDGWLAESYQREKIFDGIADSADDDIILFSDSDEIPNPKKLENLYVDHKFIIFLQNFYVYKINIFNKDETPWKAQEGAKKIFKEFYIFKKKNFEKKYF